MIQENAPISAYITNIHSLSNKHALKPITPNRYTLLEKGSITMNNPRSHMMYACILALPTLPPIPPPPFFSQPSFIRHLPLARRRSMTRRYTRWWRPTAPSHYGPSAWMLGLYVWSITAKNIQLAISHPKKSAAQYNRREKEISLSYLKSCMKWQIGQATSLYLCVASGITGYSCPISPPSSSEYP